MEKGTVLAQLDGRCKGYFLYGQNPAVGSANAKMQRKGMANLDWLVVRDMMMIESATWWKDGPDDPYARVLKIEPVTAELWDGPSNSLVAAYEFAKARITGEKPLLGENRKTTGRMGN